MTMQPLRFVVNTKQMHTAASRVCVRDLAEILRVLGHECQVNDWRHYERYNVAIFMSYDPDIEIAREKNPHLLIGLADPKRKNQKDAQQADFLIVSSSEQRDYFLQWNRNVFILPMFPQGISRKHIHKNRDRLIIGYHGNKVHLLSLFPHVTLAMEALGKERSVELVAIYNIRELGKWTAGVPDSRWVKTHHVQWHESSVDEFLPSVDIGIVPNSIFPWFYEGIKKIPILAAHLPDESDYILRYKVSSNAGRIYQFGRFGVPVVADFFPSAAEMLAHGECGFLAHSRAGWETAFRELADSPELRQRMGDRLQDLCMQEWSPRNNARRLIAFLGNLRSSVRHSCQESLSWQRIIFYLGCLGLESTRLGRWLNKRFSRLKRAWE